PDIRRVLWEKYLMITAQAGTTALTRAPIGVIRSVPETWQMYRAIVEELAAIARASGVALDDRVVETVVKAAEGLAPEALSSLYHDLVQRRRLHRQVGRVWPLQDARSGSTHPATALATPSASPVWPWAPACRSPSRGR